MAPLAGFSISVLSPEDEREVWWVVRSTPSRPATVVSSCCLNWKMLVEGCYLA
jgi:hypothetical protein